MNPSGRRIRIPVPARVLPNVSNGNSCESTFTEPRRAESLRGGALADSSATEIRKKLSKNSLDTVHATRARLATETVLATSRVPSLFKRWTSFLATLE